MRCDKMCATCGDDRCSISLNHSGSCICSRCPSLVSDGKFVKADAGKDLLDLLPTKPLRVVAKVLEWGANKYGEGNWRKVDNKRRFIRAAMRHIFSYLEGEKMDPETGLPHLAHAACSLLFLVELEGPEDGKKE